MILPLPDDTPRKPRCSLCRAPYVHGQPFVHAAGCPQGGRGVAVATLPEPKPADAGLARSSGRNLCVLGHSHDSKGEAIACPRVYTEAAHAGLTVFRPGRPGVPCFKLAPHADTGRPVYVSVDWLLCDQHGKPVRAVDYKGAVQRSKRRDIAWPRGKRIIETELGIRVEEIAQ